MWACAPADPVANGWEELTTDVWFKFIAVKAKYVDARDNCINNYGADITIPRNMDIWNVLDTELGVSVCMT